MGDTCMSRESHEDVGENSIRKTVASLVRPVRLVNLVFPPYDNTGAGKQTAGTALTSCSSIFYEKACNDITLRLTLSPSLMQEKKSFQIFKRRKPNAFGNAFPCRGRGERDIDNTLQPCCTIPSCRAGARYVGRRFREISARTRG